MADSSNQTALNQILEFTDRFTIVTYDKNMNIFAETLDSKIAMSRPVLSTLPKLTNQIELEA